jgi:hypothetical protein
VGERIKKAAGFGGARRVGIRRTILQKILQIVSGGKCARTARDNDAADRRVFLRAVNRFAHAAIHGLRDRVLLLRSIERDQPCGVFVGDDEMFGHGLWPLRRRQVAYPEKISYINLLTGKIRQAGEGSVEA